jgi:AcrR family transcriptional regulator
MILGIQNAIPSPTPDEPAADVASRIAAQTVARRGVDYTNEVRRLLDAALSVMRAEGAGGRARVADIVKAAGLSNDAFYRHFTSKDALVEALLEDGAERLRSYLAHQMAKERRPERQLRRWVEGVLSQADEEIANATLSVLWNAGSSGGGQAAGRHFASAPLATLLGEPFTAMGSTEPELDARLVAHAVLGMLSDHLWRRTRPTRGELDRVVVFCVGAASGPVAAERSGAAGNVRPGGGR